MKVLITGASGILGSSIFKIMDSAGHDVIGFNSSQININNFNDVQEKTLAFQPDIIIHCAALTDVEQAEKSPELCYQVNYTGTLNFVNAAKLANAKFIYISSTGCYGSHKEIPYAEYDDVMPPTVHHRSKFVGERVVAENHPEHLIVRTGWLFGGTIAHKKNFVYNRYLEAKSNSKITSDPFQTGTPTSVTEVAQQLLVLIEKKVCGTYNIVSEGSCTRYEYVDYIVKQFGLDCEVVKAEKPYTRIAPVSKNEAAENFNLKAMGLSIMSHWQHSLSQYINELKNYV